MNRFKLFLCLAIVFASISMQAQRFEGSVVAGFNFAQLDGDLLAGYNKGGIVAGGRVAAVLNPKWRLSLDILYSERGSRRSMREASVYEKFALNYIEIPVLAYISDWKVEFGAGLSYSRLLNYTIEDVGGENVSDSFDLRDNDLAFVADVTYYTNPKFGIGARWCQGLVNIDTDSNNQGLMGEWLSFRFVYRFNVSSLAESYN